MKMNLSDLRQIVRSEIMLEYVKAMNEEDEAPAKEAKPDAPASDEFKDNIKDRESGNAFRAWANTPAQIKKFGKESDLDLDASGSHKNRFIRKAWKAGGKEYLKSQTPEGKSRAAGEASAPGSGKHADALKAISSELDAIVAAFGSSSDDSGPADSAPSPFDENLNEEEGETSEASGPSDEERAEVNSKLNDAMDAIKSWGSDGAAKVAMADGISATLDGGLTTLLVNMASVGYSAGAENKATTLYGWAKTLAEKTSSADESRGFQKAQATWEAARSGEKTLAASEGEKAEIAKINKTQSDINARYQEYLGDIASEISTINNSLEAFHGKSGPMYTLAKRQMGPLGALHSMWKTISAATNTELEEAFERIDNDATKYKTDIAALMSQFREPYDVLMATDAFKKSGWDFDKDYETPWKTPFGKARSPAFGVFDTVDAKWVQNKHLRSHADLISRLQGLFTKGFGPFMVWSGWNKPIQKLDSKDGEWNWTWDGSDKFDKPEQSDPSIWDKMAASFMDLF